MRNIGVGVRGGVRARPPPTRGFAATCPQAGGRMSRELVLRSTSSS